MSEQPLILVVDDDALQLRATARLMRTAGYRVLEAASGGECLALVRQQRPDLVLLDVMLPDADGFEICRRIKADPATADTFVVHVTACMGSPRDQVEGLQGGADSYIVLPIDNDEFVARVQAVVRIREAETAQKKACAEMEQRVEQRTAELREANEQLKREVAQRQRVQDALQHSRDKLQTILDSLPDVVMQIAPDMTVTWANRTALTMRPDANGKRCFQVFSEQPHAGPCPECPVARCLKSGKPEMATICHATPVDLAGAAWWTTTGIPLKDPAGTVVGAIEFARNITESKKAEENLRQAQKLESVGILAGGVAHEFNNLLGGMIGYAENARDAAGENGSVVEPLDEILKLGTRAGEIVQQILAFSRRGELRRKPVRPHLVIEESLKILRASIPATIEIRRNIDRHAGTVLADQTQLQQVCMNLCLNAAHAMEPGGGVLAISLSRIELDAGAAMQQEGLQPGTYVRLTVSDTGTGMDDHIKAHMFDPFFTTKKAGMGTGMGLSVVHGIVKKHGGAITVASTPGRGTTVTVLFPEAGREAEDRPEAAPLPTGTERILMVDDESFMVVPQKKMLERLGYTVTALTDSREALELFKQNPQGYDLLITDLTMPHLNGERLAAEVATLRPDLPVILATGYADAVERESVTQAGFRACIPKPCTKANLARTVRRVLDGHEPET